ncbi:putative phosphonate metabolism protein [Carnobacterium sp. 17-4]|uniref:phosphonate C-P lyase system protein PhnG n=1 Tax=Carnobacterium sp. (strain 17-4) TaxID=208596 RepID=UPI0002059218|nr:phosphonate C-P lyase system protein PhnG [Carnobacterium sp. 17-4]AEB29208.1 putative phosphonate metabolism protein [Carnobacterium sp. 17-4]
MNRKRRTRILIDFGKEESLKLAEIIENNYPIEMISEPSEALTMIKVRESAKNSLFYLGEVLITETKVRIEGKVGIGIVKGHETKFSRALAIIDAAYSAELPETAEWFRILKDIETTGEEAVGEKQRQLAQTKVNFETMNQ